MVDHINGNKLDNRRSNIRICTQAENHQNRQYSYSSSGKRGVSWDDSSNKWQTKVVIAGKGVYLGVYATIEEADAVVCAYRAKNMPFSQDARNES